MNITTVGEGKVELIAGGGRVYTDIAAKFCRSNKSMEDIVGSEYNKNLVQHIINSGHLAATEFDYYIFGVSGYSRVTEAQLIRKRLASYMISSGRAGKDGYNLTIPNSIKDKKVVLVTENNSGIKGMKHDGTVSHDADFYRLEISVEEYLKLGERLYNSLIDDGIEAEDARYIKPQATSFKAVIGMNAHSLIDWFKIRCCNRAQFEIRDMALKMLAICKETKPNLFANAGPSCKGLGFCPEMEQCKECVGKIPTASDVKQLLGNYWSAK